MTVDNIDLDWLQIHQLLQMIATSKTIYLEVSLHYIFILSGPSIRIHILLEPIKKLVRHHFKVLKSITYRSSEINPVKKKKKRETSYETFSSY